MLLTPNRLALIGMTFVGLGLVCSLFLVADIMFGTTAAAIATIAAAIGIGALWFGLPLVRKQPGTGERPRRDRS
jgi:hypothetical protein